MMETHPYGHGYYSRADPAVLVSPYLVVVAFLVMVSLNIASQVVYGSESTTGYAYPYLQPDGATFGGAWGLIYFLQAAFVISQTWVPAIRDDERVVMARPAYIMSCALNGAWLMAQAQANRGGLSSYWMACSILVANVVYLYFGVYWFVGEEVNRFKGESRPAGNDFSSRWYLWRSYRSFQFRWLVWYPISTNLAWIVVASILNISSTAFDLAYLQVHETEIGGPDWAIGVAFGATVLAVHNAITRQDLGYSWITIWALWGIYRNQSPNSQFPHPRDETLSDAALLGIGLVCLGLVIGWTIQLLETLTRPKSDNEMNKTLMTPDKEASEENAPPVSEKQSIQAV